MDNVDKGEYYYDFIHDLNCYLVSLVRVFITVLDFLDLKLCLV